MTTLELLQTYLKIYFVEHAPEKELELVTEDIHCYGFANDVAIENIEDARNMLASGDYQRFMNYKLDIEKGEQVSEESAVLLYSLTHNSVCIKYRIAGHSRKTQKGNRLYFINNNMVNPFQTLDMFDTIARERRVQIARDVLENSIPGGIVGSYLEPGCPLYFVNDKLLKHLGYASKDEFERAIDGKLENYVDPRDRSALSSTIAKQLAIGDEYSADYRVFKKNGSIIWVHENGKRINTEDGREAILSALYDITSEKEHDRFLQGIVTSLNGDLVLLAVDTAHKCTIPVYVSDNMGEQQGITKEEYLHQYDHNAMDSIYAGDRERVWKSILHAIQSDAAPAISFRILERDGNTKWMNASFTKHGEQDGMPVLLVLFTASTIQNELQIHALNQNGIGIALIDADTKEIYYVNNGLFQMIGLHEMDYVGKKCPDVLLGCGGSCDNCQLQQASDDDEMDSNIYVDGKWLSIHTERKPWADKTVISIYAKDITTQHQLRERQEMMQSACEFAKLLTWVYDIPNDRIFPSMRLQQDFGMPQTLENYPEAWFDMGFVQPEYVELHRQKVLAIKNGSDNEEFEAKVRHKDGVHWARIILSRMQGSPNLAACSSQLIDNEKQLQARLELEKKRVLSSDRGLRGYVISNVSKNAVYDRDITRSDAQQATVSLTMEQAMENAMPDIMEADRGKYRAVHNREMLLEAYQQGKTSLEFIGHRAAADGTFHWMRSALNLVKDPATEDILLYECIYDIHGQMMADEIMQAATAYMFERAASVNIKANQMTVISTESTAQMQDVTVWNYAERADAYCRDTVIPEDRAAFAKAVCLQTVADALESKDEYGFVIRVREADDSIGYRRTRFCYYNREMGICLMTRVDVTKIILKEEQRSRQLAAALRQTQEVLAAKEELEQDRELLYAALFNMVPLVISANVTQETYIMLNYDGFHARKTPAKGSYEELVSVGATTIPDDQKEAFRTTFSKENILKAYAEGKKEVELTHQQYGDDGVLRWIETRSILVKDEKTGDLHAITLAQDVTDRKQEQLNLQKALETAESATQAKSEFLSRMSHEIRTPMNAIMGMTAIAKENRSDFRQVAECLDKIDMSSHFLLTLINDILEMSRIESGRMEIKHSEFGFAFLMKSIRTVVEPLALKSDIRYDCVCDAETDSYYIGDAMRIQQVIVNIISNAIKFTKSGGRVRFTVQIEHETPTKTQFKFVIADTGIGMRESFMKRMFQPFTQEDGSNTSEFAGSGLGLAISKSLTEAMGGTIHAESFLGVGSTFTIRIPMERVTDTADTVEPLEPAEETHAGSIEILRGCHVLMAEDHPLNIMVARKVLERKGVNVTVAENGRIAVDIFQASTAGYYDAILMDIRMPVMDGWDATLTIRALKHPDAKSIPIIAMTANALEEDRRHSRDVGMNEHLAKPFEPIQLYTILADQIAKRKKQ